jgi:outer membrane lipoprotein-sorting protein
MARALLVGCALALCAGSAKAAPGVDELLARIEKSSSVVNTLAGEFTQKNRLKMFKQEITSKGRFFYQRPRKVRWEYTEPDPSTMVLDGDTATLRTPGVPAQTFDLAKDPVMRAVFDQLLLWVGAGSLSRAKADYALSAGGTDAAPLLTLTPNPGGPIAKAFKRIDLELDKDLLLKTILLVEPNGDEKKIVFSKMTRNAKLPADAFTP